MAGNSEDVGPIDVVVIGYPPGAPMTGEAVPIFLDLVDRGIIRVLDALFVRKEADGTFSGFDLADLDEETAGDLTVFAGATTGLAGLDLPALNIPSEDEYVAAYCSRTGRDGIGDIDFYMAFNMFRLAAIVHGIKGRVARGTASSGHAAKMAASLEPLADLAWSQAVRAEAR